MAKTSFVRLWTKRFLKYQGGGKASTSVIHRYAGELHKAHSGSWCRLVLELADLSAHWGIADYPKTAKDLEKLFAFIEQLHGYPTLIRPRNFFSINSGVQVWFSSDEDLTVWKLRGFRTSNTRVFSQQEFQDTLWYYLGSQNQWDNLSPIRKL